MADTPMNISLGRGKEYAIRARDGVVDTAPALTVVLLKAAEADDALRDHDDLGALLGVAGNTEADFTNYARRESTTTDVTVTVDDTANDMVVDIPDETWTSAGGTTDNTLAKLLITYDPDTGVADDATMPGVTQHDFSVTTDGSDLTANIVDPLKAA